LPLLVMTKSINCIFKRMGIKQWQWGILALVLQIQVRAQPLVKTDWTAQWVAPAGETSPNGFLRYRHVFSVKAMPAQALAHIACDSKYWLYVNGQLVVFEGQLKRGPTPNDTYYDEVDLAPFLRKGYNTLAILVWYWGKEGFSHKSSGKAGLLFELPTIGVVSNGQWKCLPHRAYQNSQPPHPNFRLPEHNIRYDARLDNEDWIQPSFDDRAWPRATPLGIGGCAPWNRLWKRPIPHWHNSGLLDYAQPPTIQKDTYTMALPYNTTITPYFKIKAPAGLSIDIRTDNYEGGSAPNVRAEYVTKEGQQEFESPAYMNGHQVVYRFPKGVTVLALKYRETKYDTKLVGGFASNDAFFNRLWQKSATTLDVNMRDGIFDSPDRERAQWWGDIVIVLEEIFYSCDAKALAAIQKAISNLLEWQKPDGSLFSPIPAGNWDKELPAQMLAAVGKYGIWKYIEHSGDTAMVRYAYPFIKKYLGLWQLNDQGLVQHRTGGWDWHDWGEQIDVPLLDNAWYYMALEGAYNMAMHLQLNNEATGYQRQMESIQTNFQKYFWKGNRFASDAYAFGADDRGNGLAVCAGLVSKQQWRALRPMLDTTFHAGPYLEKYILESYFIMENAAAGLARMKKRYADMVSHPGITTLWEGWEIGSATYGGGTYNHGWTGGPLSLLSAYVAGIRPTGKGYATYSIQPQPGGLTNFSCRTQTARGTIRVSWQVQNGRFLMYGEAPAAKGIIGVPKLGQRAKVLSVVADKKYFAYIGEDAAYWYYECSRAGKWVVKGEW
jgi:alpha-L-rhamnosidase